MGSTKLAKYLWTADTGATHVVHPREPGDDMSKSRKAAVDLAADLTSEGGLMPSGEVVLPGSRLIPVGRSVRLGKWTFCWGPNGRPYYVRLTEKQEKMLSHLLGSAPGFQLAVDGDIPVMTDDQARVIRDSISLTKSSPDRVQASIARTNRLKNLEILGLIGIQDVRFLRWVARHKGCVPILRAAIARGTHTKVSLLNAWRSPGHQALEEIIESLQTPVDPGGGRGVVSPVDETVVLVPELSPEIHVAEGVIDPPPEEPPEPNDENFVDPSSTGGCCGSNGVSKGVTFGREEIFEFFNDDDDAHTPSEIDPSAFKACIEAAGEMGFEECELARMASVASRKLSVRVKKCTIESSDDEISDGRDISVRAMIARKRRANNSVPTVELSERDLHCLTHFPASPNCEVCQWTRRTKAKKTRGTASDQNSKGAAGGDFLVMDWVNPSTTATDGSKYLAVIANITSGALFCRGYKVKKANSQVALHSALTEWSMEGKAYTLHSDNERVLGDAQMQDYMRLSGGIAWKGVPHESNTNSRVEHFCRKSAEGIRALLFQAGLPGRCWHIGARAFSTEYSRSQGVAPRRNSARVVPFGALGEAILPTKLVFRDKFCTKTKWVMHLGACISTSGGVNVMYMGANNRLKQGVVLDRDVKWHPEKRALTRRREGLKDVMDLFPDMTPDNPIQPCQVFCDGCEKWRMVEEKVEIEFQEKPFLCKDIGMDCSEPEDPRVWKEYSPSEFEENEEGESVAPDEPEEVEEIEEEVVRARRCQIVAKSCVANLKEECDWVDGGTPETDAEMREALIRLGIFRCETRDLEKMNQIAKGEMRACKDEQVRVCSLVVRGK